MKLILRASAGRTTLDVVVGCGLIGDALCRSITLLPSSTVAFAESIPVDWSTNARLAGAFRMASVRIDAMKTTPDKVRVFWCAGRAGFAAAESQAGSELEAFGVAIAWAERLAARTPTEFHMTSSAGGLHEGQLLVREPTRMNTTRPYARLKLAQEGALIASSLQRRFIYRPSSVYGLPRSGQRLGLLPTMIRNALCHRPTLVTANAATQRDFVAASDVAAFMALERDGTPSMLGRAAIFYLVHGRPLSIWALQLAVERHLQRRLLVTFTTSKDNFDSTTFSCELRAASFRPTSLECNLARIIAAVQGHRGVQ